MGGAGAAGLALLWRDVLGQGARPFHRIWFKVKAPGCAKAECVAVLPKTSIESKVQSLKLARLPVLIYLHGSGGELMTDGNELRQMAEMGLAAIGMDYDQASEPASEAQFTALLAWGAAPEMGRYQPGGLGRFQPRGAADTRLCLGHPQAGPNLLVRMSGGWVDDLDPRPPSWSPTPPSPGPLPSGEGERATPDEHAHRWLGRPPRPKALPSPFGRGSR